MANDKIQAIISGTPDPETSFPTGRFLVQPGEAPTREIVAHFFDSTEDAYDASQSSDGIMDGDLLIIPSERVIGILVQAWPTSVTEEHGEFSIVHGRWSEVENGRYTASVDVAQTLIAAWGLEDEPHPRYTDAQEITEQEAHIVESARLFDSAVGSYIHGLGLDASKVEAYASHAGITFEEAARRVQAQIKTEDELVGKIMGEQRANPFAELGETDQAVVDAINELLSPVDATEVRAEFNACVTAFMHDDMITYARCLARFAQLSGQSPEGAAKAVRDHVLGVSGFTGGVSLEEYDFGPSAPQHQVTVVIPWPAVITLLMVGFVVGAFDEHLAHLIIWAAQSIFQLIRFGLGIIGRLI